jgi:D-proline reductase (dithiol) PrdB
VPRLERLPAKLRDGLLAQTVASHDTCPATLPRVPLAQARVALVTTAGLHLRGDRPFRGEDPGYRFIPSTAESHELLQSHSSIGFDRSGMQRDINVVFPIDRLREFEREGVIGSLAPRFLSFMGAQADPEHVLAAAASQAGDILIAEGADVVLLTPT